MTLYEVQVEQRRSWTIYVEADDFLSAEETAEELAMDFDPDDVESDAAAYEVASNSILIRDTADVWVGGEEGRFISYPSYKRGVR